MRKIPTMFVRDDVNPSRVTNAVTPGCEWAAAGEGIPTAKWDGTACLVRDGKLYKRYDAKRGKTPPEGWGPCEAAPDPVTGHWPGWALVGDGPGDRWHREAFESQVPPDGTYELIGPRVGANPHNVSQHTLVPHGQVRFTAEAFADRSFEGIRAALARIAWEGIVFYHPDGRMAKAKRRDFGLPWPLSQGA